MNLKEAEWDGTTTLDTLPMEILLKIFHHLNAPFLLRSVRLVCKYFYLILDDFFWKTKYKNSIQKKPCVLNEVSGLDENIWRPGAEIGWLDLAYHIDLEWLTWDTNFHHIKSVHFATHFAAIDTVILLNESTICVTGGRDRQLVVWDLVSDSNTPLACDTRSHTGWIWDTASNDREKFFTCGWDSCVFHWSLDNGDLQEISSFYVEKPCMCIDTTPGLVVVGLNGGKVGLFDPRMNLRNLYTYGIHRHVITDTKLIGNSIYSTSEDKTIGVYELRMLRPLKPNIRVGKSSFPRCIAHKKNMLWVGDNKGVVRLYNAYQQNELIHEFPASKTGLLITDIWAGVGTIITGSIDRRVRIITATKPTTVVKEIPIGGEVTRIDYANNTLAVGSADNILRVYKTHDACDTVFKNL